MFFQNFNQSVHIQHHQTSIGPMENLSSGFSCTPECLSSAVNFSPILRKTWTAHSDSSLERTNGNFPLLPQFSASFGLLQARTAHWARSSRTNSFNTFLTKKFAAGVYFTSLYSLIQGATTNFWELGGILFSETCPCLLSAANLFTASRYAMSKAWSNLICWGHLFPRHLSALLCKCRGRRLRASCCCRCGGGRSRASGWLCDKAWGAERRRPSRKGLWKRSFCEWPRACGKASSRVLAFVSLSLCFPKNNQTNTLASWTVEHWL